MPQQVAGKLYEINGYKFAIRSIDAMEAFVEDLAETNLWVLQDVAPQPE